MEFFIIFLWSSNLFGAQIDHFDWARVSENWHSAADNWKWPSLGSELTTFIYGIISKLLFQWGKERFNLNWFFIWRKMKKYNITFAEFAAWVNERRKVHICIFAIWNMCDCDFMDFQSRGPMFKSSGWLQVWLSLSSFQGW